MALDLCVHIDGQTTLGNIASGVGIGYKYKYIYILVHISAQMSSTAFNITNTIEHASNELLIKQLT